MTLPIWSSTVSFGLVTIPVRLVPAISSRPTAMTMLHEKDHAPLERQMVCPKDDRVVDAREQIRGYEISDGEYVTVTDEELESLAPEQSQAIEIEAFVELQNIDPLFFDRPYYLSPGKGADKPYWLLVRALGDSGKAGIAKFVLREREHLVALWAAEDALCLTTLHFQRQLVSPKGLSPEKTRVSHDDLDSLVAHIGKASRHFDPARYPDENELRLMRLVRKHAKKEGVEKAPSARRRSKLSKQKAAGKIDEVIREIKS